MQQIFRAGEVEEITVWLKLELLSHKALPASLLT